MNTHQGIRYAHYFSPCRFCGGEILQTRGRNKKFCDKECQLSFIKKTKTRQTNTTVPRLRKDDRQWK